ncbi:hypothetical protein D1793_16660 [Halomonas sp. JS92-SW72]|nr:hypothetical protein D1793_16660 [Halomonas sp. JS92-SW72]
MYPPDDVLARKFHQRLNDVSHMTISIDNIFVMHSIITNRMILLEMLAAKRQLQMVRAVAMSLPNGMHVSPLTTKSTAIQIEF